ncbi:MAG: NAD-dependent succinate-semialdehyde dehydrogenase [Acidimicrobiia bacterium]
MTVNLTRPELLTTQAYIDGERIDADSGKTFDVVDPATGESIASVADMSSTDTARAITAAEQARHAWAARTTKDRGAVLRRWAELLKENTEDLAAIMTAEMGKPLSESRGEVGYAAGFIDWYAEEAKRAYGDVIPTHDASKRLLTLRQPVGVVGAITPWNFPLAMITRKLGPAFAAGCAAVVKPSELAPLSALSAAYLAEEAGLPRGLMNVVPTADPAAVGGELTANPLVRKISFTGSTAVGKMLMQQSASTVKRVSMELGGNAPFVVFDDADLDAAVEGLIQSKYRNAGQTCVCANRVLVQSGVYDDFAKRLAVAVQDLAVGPGVDEATDIGPLVSDAAIEKVESLVNDACEHGATALTGGKRHELGRTFYEVTVLTDVTPEMQISSAEIFGPVAPLFRFETEAQAIEMANDTPFGLASYFFAADLGRIWRVAEGLEYGLVAVNTGLMSTEVAPFGGYKESGVGREGSHEGLDEYLETKYVAIGL